MCQTFVDMTNYTHTNILATSFMAYLKLKGIGVCHIGDVAPDKGCLKCYCHEF